MPNVHSRFIYCQSIAVILLGWLRTAMLILIALVLHGPGYTHGALIHEFSFHCFALQIRTHATLFRGSPDLTRRY